MKRVRWVLASALLASAIACSAPARNQDGDAEWPIDLDARSTTRDATTSAIDAFAPIADAGVSIDPAIDAAFDAGRDAGSDAGRDAGRDAGSDAGRDAYMPPPICGEYRVRDVYDVPRLPASCMPRCTNATRRAIDACPDDAPDECLEGALAADPTAPVAVVNSAGARVGVIGCNDCYTLQLYSCYADVCPYYAGPLLWCNPTRDPDGCSGERTSLALCLEALSTANRARLDGCVSSAVMACFDTRGGFLPAGDGAW